MILYDGILLTRVSIAVGTFLVGTIPQTPSHDLDQQLGRVESDAS